eukprot:g6518.t1
MAGSEIRFNTNSRTTLNDCPDAAFRLIAKYLTLSPTRDHDIPNACLAVPHLMKEFREYFTSISSQQLSKLNLTFRDLRKFPGLFYVDLDFADQVGNFEHLSVLVHLRYLKELKLTNLDTRYTDHVGGSCPFADDVVFNPRQQCFPFLPPIFSLNYFIRFRSSHPIDLSESKLAFLTRLSALEKLTLNHCDKCLKKVIQVVKKIPQLKVFRLLLREFDCKDIKPLRGLKAELDLHIIGAVSRQAISELYCFPTLTSMTLEYCRLDNFSLSRLKQLKNLRIKSTYLTDQNLKNLRKIRNALNCLEIELKDTCPQHLIDLCRANLLTISIAVSMPVFETDDSLSLCTKLESLAIFSTEEHFDGEVLSCLGSLTRLKRLCIYGCADWTSILPNLSLFGSNLESITIGWCVTRGEMLRDIAKLRSLRELTLYMCFLLVDLSPMKDFTNLEKLSIRLCPMIENSLCEILPQYLPKTLNQLCFEFRNSSELDSHEDLLALLYPTFPSLKVSLVEGDLWDYQSKFTE